MGCSVCVATFRRLDGEPLLLASLAGSSGRAAVGAQATAISLTNRPQRARWALRTASSCGHLAGVVGIVPRGY